MNPLIGKVIKAIYLAQDKEALRFDVEGEEKPLVVRCNADCCSHTWVENIQGAEQILNSPIVKVEDIEMPDLGNIAEEEDSYASEYIAYYGCKITSERGFCVIDYRNSSNGYYGGSLSWPNEGYFYGGVFGQNKSKEEWVKVL